MPPITKEDGRISYVAAYSSAQALKLVLKDGSRLLSADLRSHVTDDPAQPIQATMGIVPK
jgi:hypothetical protein